MNLPPSSPRSAPGRFPRAAAGAAAVALSLMVAAAGASAQEATIRKVLAERLPQLSKIDEVTRSPVPGLWEVRYSGTEILYSDDKGDFIIVGGSVIDTKTRTDLTEARVNKLLAIDYGALPLKDAFVIKQGDGSRRLAVFVDPNCGYCKRFERDLATVKNVTIHTFLLPILGPDSAAKSRDIWCAKDPGKVWREWMIDGQVPPKSAAGCNADALARNVAFARERRITGTPAVLFEDGTRRPGAIPAAAVEEQLATASRAASAPKR